MFLLLNKIIIKLKPFFRKTKTKTKTKIKMFNPIFKVRDWIHLYSKELFDKLKTQLEEYTLK